MDTTQTTSSTERITRTKTAKRRTSTSEKYDKNMTINVTAITTSTVIGNIVQKATIRSGETTSTEAISKAPQVPEAKASGNGGEESVILDLLRSMYFTYRFMKGTLLKDLRSAVLVMRNRVCYAK